MALNDWYPVHVNGGKALILNLGGASVGGSNGLGTAAMPATPIFRRSTGKPLTVATVNGSFFYDGSAFGCNFDVAHGWQGTFITPVFIEILPALRDTGAVWVSSFGQRAAADNTSFKMYALGGMIAGAAGSAGTYNYNALCWGIVP